MSEPDHCVLQVIRVTDIQKRPKDAKLYVQIELGESTSKSGDINDDGAPGWHDTFTFPRLDASTVFKVSLKTKRRFRDDLLGCADIMVAQLSEEFVGHDVQLRLQTAPHIFGTGDPELKATVLLSFKEIDTLSRARLDVEAVEQSVEKIKASSEKSESVIAVIGSIIEVVDVIVGVVDKVAEIHPVFDVSWKAASALYKLVSYQYEADRKLVDTVEKMKTAYEYSTAAGTLDDRTEMLKPLVKQLLNVSIECSRFVQEYARHSFVGRTPRVLSKERIEEFAAQFVDLRKEMNSVLVLTVAKASDEIRQQQVMDSRIGLETNQTIVAIKLQQQLEYHLSPLKSDVSGVSKRPRCLEGTRREYLGAIMDFIYSDSAPNVLLLTGAAGSGKSTIAMTASDECDKMGCNAAYLFFDRGKSEPNSVIRTIAFKLAVLHPSIAFHISEAIEKNRNINGNTLKTQFEGLLLGPLNAAMEALARRIVVILDALDECGSVEERRDLLRVLKDGFARLPSKVRFLVTSRPEGDIMEEIATCHIQRISLEHRSKESREDVGVYLRKEMFEAVKGKAPKGWVWGDINRLLTNAADGLFIWASTAVKMVSATNRPEKKLGQLLENIRSVDEYGIDSLYATALGASGIDWNDVDCRRDFIQILGLVLASKEAMSEAVIEAFLGIEEGAAKLTLMYLRSVLSYKPGQCVRLHHASFADYLLSTKRSGAESWHISEASQRLTVAGRCLNVMAKELRFNICDIESSFIYNKDNLGLQKRIEKNIMRHLDYACLFWAAHVCELSQSMDLSGLLEELNAFAHNHLLHWFEVLSLTGNFNRVAVGALYEVSLWAAPINPDLSSFLWGAYRLASVFSYPMSHSAPQVYLSAVSLWCGESRVADHYSASYPSVPVHRYGSKPPAQCIKIIHELGSQLESFASSPDGKHVVSGSADGTLRVWDADTGELVSGPLMGHTGRVNSVAFSPDGTCVVSGSVDRTIRIWNAVTGELISGIKGHEGGVYSVAFVPGGKRIVSGSSDNTICVWDADSGKLVSGPFKGHTGTVYSVAVSLDGTRVISGSADETIRIWDAESGMLISKPFKGHTQAVMSVAFSPDGKYVVSGSEDGTIRVWNIETGELCKAPFEGDIGPVRSVSFSVDGRRFVSGSDDKTVRIWDSNTGDLIAGPFEGHTDGVSSVAFSLDGKRVISGSIDCTIRVWDSDSSVVPSGPFKGHKSTISAVSFSADGKRAVSGYRDGAMNVWDTEACELVSDAFKESTAEIRLVALSPDGGLVASGSGDATFHVWNASSGELVSGPFEGHTRKVSSVAFSPDGNRIVSGSWDNTIRIWNAKTGELVSGPLEGHTDLVTSVAFSPNGNLVVSGSVDGTIRIWNAVRGKLVSGPFQGVYVTSVAFSPDGERVVSCSRDMTISVWNTHTGKVVLGPLKGHKDWVNAVAFSLDGKRIVSGSGDKTVRVWDAVSGKLVWVLFGHRYAVLSVAFSQDGRHVLSGSYWNGTIRKWDVGSGKVTYKQVSQRSKNLPAAPAAFSRTLVANRDAEGSGSVSNWKMEDDGWIVTERGELLTWVPEDMRNSIWGPRNTAVFGRQFSTRYDFANAPLGLDWHKGFPRLRMTR